MTYFLIAALIFVVILAVIVRFLAGQDYDETEDMVIGAIYGVLFALLAALIWPLTFVASLVYLYLRRRSKR